MLENPRKGYLLLNIEPELDCANPLIAQAALEEADCVVSLSLYKNPLLLHYAHVILPIAPYTETAGTFINAAGQWQRFNGIATPVGEARPAWKVLRVLGNLFHCPGFDYETAHEIHHELKALVDAAVPIRLPSLPHPRPLPKDAKLLSRIGEIPIYAGDSLQRRAKALQATQRVIEGDLVAVRLHPQTAQQLQVKAADVVFAIQGENRVKLPVIVDERIPLQAAYIPGGILATQHLSELYGRIEIYKA
jgi:NADH-quinone oxidoreductase subunit G